MAGLNNVDPNAAVNNGGGGGSVTILPDDDYCLELYESDIKPNSGGTGKNLDYKVKVVEGPFKDTWFFSGITSIEHTSSQAQAIGQGQLRALAHATDVAWPPSDTEQFHYRPFWARVRSETYFSKKHQKDMTKNVIAKFLWEGMPEDDAPAPPSEKSAATSPPPPPPPAPAAGRRPWDKPKA